MVMVRFVRVCLDAFPMCHPQVIRSRKLMRHNGGNTLKYQDNCEGLKTLPLNPMECGKCSGANAGRISCCKPASRLSTANWALCSNNGTRISSLRKSPSRHEPQLLHALFWLG